MTAGPELSVVIPARGAGGAISSVLDQLFDAVRLPCEVLVVVDDAADGTLPVIESFAATEPRLRCLLNGYGPGPAQAVRYGMDAARGGVIVVLAADGSDDVTQVGELASLVKGGAAVAAASRYMTAESHPRVPRLRRVMSQVTGRSLQLLARPGTCDAMNSFKAYSAAFIAAVGIDSRRGYPIGIELTAKARRLRLPVAEIPASWVDRPASRSWAELARWLPGYLRWYLFCFGRPLTVSQLRASRGRPARQPAAALGVPPGRLPHTGAG